ncbi:MAG: flagellar hook-length control protein FliK [Pseudomonas sp.]
MNIQLLLATLIPTKTGDAPLAQHGDPEGDGFLAVLSQAGERRTVSAAPPAPLPLDGSPRQALVSPAAMVKEWASGATATPPVSTMPDMLSTAPGPAHQTARQPALLQAAPAAHHAGTAQPDPQAAQASPPPAIAVPISGDEEAEPRQELHIHDQHEESERSEIVTVVPAPLATPLPAPADVPRSSPKPVPSPALTTGEPTAFVPQQSKVQRPATEAAILPDIVQNDVETAPLAPMPISASTTNSAVATEMPAIRAENGAGDTPPVATSTAKIPGSTAAALPQTEPSPPSTPALVSPPTPLPPPAPVPSQPGTPPTVGITDTTSAVAGDFKQDTAEARLDSHPVAPGAAHGVQDNAMNARATTLSVALATPLASPVWGQHLGDQLVKLVHSGNQRVSLQLNPAELGPLVVDIMQHADHELHLHLTALSPAARNAAEQAIPQLRESLAEQGITLGQASVGEQGSRRDFSEQAAPQRRDGRTGDSGQESETPILRVEVAPAGRVNVYV